jgi:hypothetical protein
MHTSSIYIYNKVEIKGEHLYQLPLVMIIKSNQMIQTLGNQADQLPLIFRTIFKQASKINEYKQQALIFYSKLGNIILRSNDLLD